MILISYLEAWKVFLPSKCSDKRIPYLLTPTITKIKSTTTTTTTTNSVGRNYYRVMDLLSRGESVSGQKSSNLEGIDEANAPYRILETSNASLAFDEAGARNAISKFPHICLYKFHELEERVRFLLSPLISEEKVKISEHVTHRTASSQRKRGNKQFIQILDFDGNLHRSFLGIDLTILKKNSLPNLQKIRADSNCGIFSHESVDIFIEGNWRALLLAQHLLCLHLNSQNQIKFIF